MIIPDHKAANLSPAARKALEMLPLAFMGALIPYSKQAEIIRRWLDELPKVMVVTGWKRTAKTCTGAWLGAAWLYGKIDCRWPAAKAMGIKTDYSFANKYQKHRSMVIGGKTLEHIENILLRQYTDLLPLGVVRRAFSRAQHTMNLHNGASAIIRTYDQSIELWKSGAYGLIHLDEEPPLEILNECLERTRTTSGRIIITVAVDDADVSYLPDACGNPTRYFGTDSFIHAQLGVEDVPEDIYPEKEKTIVFSQYDNTPLKDAVRKGSFAHLSGKWWAEFSHTHIIPPFPIPNDWKKWRSVDAGVAAPTGCLWVAMHPEYAILFAYREYYRTGTTIAERCKDIIEMSGNSRQKDGDYYVERMEKEHYEQTLIDYHIFHQDEVTGGGLDLEYIKNGLVITPSTTLGQEARREITRKWLFVDQRQKHFITHEPGAPRLYVFSTCLNLIQEANAKCVKRASSDRGRIPERKIDNRGDHLLDCGENLACELSCLVETGEVF